MQREGSRAASTNKSRDWSQEPDDVDIIPNLSNFVDVQHSFVAFVRSFVRSFSHVVNQWLSSLANLVIRSISWSVRHCAIRWFSYLVFFLKNTYCHWFMQWFCQTFNAWMDQWMNQRMNQPIGQTRLQPTNQSSHKLHEPLPGRGVTGQGWNTRSAWLVGRRYVGSKIYMSSYLYSVHVVYAYRCIYI